MKLVKNLSVNVFQLLLNQAFGLGIFYILSACLEKKDFGQINLALAVLLSTFNILSLGIDQLVVKRVASGAPVSATLSIYIVHVLLTGIPFYGILLLGYLVFPGNTTYSLILCIGIGKLMLFFSSPFKQVASGLEKFKLLASMSLISNLIRCIALITFALFHAITVPIVVLVFVAGDLAELLLGIYLFRHSISVPIKNFQFNKTSYIELLRNALPQTGVVVITSALARFDWIFIGFILTAIKLAEYSFAYKVFEMATLPLLAIAPLLLPLFTRKFQQQDLCAAQLQFLIRIELIVATGIGLLLNICWSPVMDWATSGKYGQVNVTTIFILSLSMPLLYVNNFLWTIYFAQGRLKMILSSFILTLCVNVAGDIILIPIYKNEGAAFAFLLSCLAQSTFYLKKSESIRITAIVYPLIICTGCALTTGFLIRNLLPDNWPVWLLSCILYLSLLSIMGQVKFSDREKLQKFLNW